MGFAETMLGADKRVSIAPRLSLLAPVIKCVLSFFLQHRSRYEPHPSACRRFRMALSVPAIRAHNRKRVICQIPQGRGWMFSRLRPKRIVDVHEPNGPHNR